MHELSLATEIIERVQQKIMPDEELRTVQVSVGLLAGICPDSLRFCFDELAKLEGYPEARLSINQPPAHYRCQACQADYYITSVESPCPFCAMMERTMISGAEFTIDFIEVIEQGACHV